MRNGTRARAWLATVFAVVGLGLCVLTLVWSEWVELLFGVDPDAGSGALELLLAGAFLVVSVLLAGQARRDWRIWHQGNRPIADP
jgi:preprotein translocase subunit SecG